MILTGLFIIIAYVGLAIQAENNDDPGMMQYISGFYSCKPGILPYIMMAPYTFIISRLYMLTTAVPWYGISFIVINTAALFIILEKILRNKCTLKRYAFFMCLFISLFLYQCVDIQFTKVAGLAGCAAVMLIYDDEDGAIIIRDIILSALFTFFAFNIRYQCGYILLCVMIYMVLSNLILFHKWNKKQVLGLVICVLVVLVSSFVNSCYINNTGWKKYEQLNSQRSLFMDTEKKSFEDAEVLYESVGWDEDIYYLISNWCFMLDEANQDAFETINSSNHGNVLLDRLSIRGLYSAAIRFIKSLIVESTFFLLWFVVIVIAFILEVKEKKYRWTYIFGAAGFFLLSLGLVFCLLLFGRYNSRTVIMILNLCYVPGTYALMKMLENTREGLNKWILFATLSGIMIVSMINGTKKLSDRYIFTYDKWENVYAYVTERKENIYVGDSSMIEPGNLFKTFTADSAPTNYFFWGGWLAESPFDKAHKEYNNLEHLTLEDMLDSNKFFIGDESNIEHLMSYYQKRYGDVRSYIYFEGEGFTVYGFRKEE